MYNGGSLSQKKMVTQTTANGQTTSATHTLDFTYDASGSPLAVTYDGTVYYYALNLQGDVLAILNGSGSTVVSYTYDAWGYEKTCTGTLSGTLGYYNPLRYRGYVYDTETESYYLQSRYYDPTLGRFINADAFASTGQGLLGNNMFAYCLNNPVAYSDATGNAARSCLAAEGSIDNAPWRNISPSGGGRPSGNYSSGNSYGSVADKFYTVRLIKFVANTDEQVVLDAKYFAFYKGVPYIKADLGNGGAFSFIVVIFDDSYSANNGGIDVVKHEYGHIVHLNQIGVVNYAFKVALPSLACAALTNSRVIPQEYYHSIPTEYIADWLGRANHRSVTSWEDSVGIAYWLWTIVGS